MQSGWDWDSQVKKGGIAGLTGKKGRERGSGKPIGDPHDKSQKCNLRNNKLFFVILMLYNSYNYVYST